MLILMFFVITNICLTSEESKLRRPLLEPYNYKIILPDLNYPYFLLSDKYKFESDKTDFSLINAWWLSEISFITYAEPTFTKQKLKKAGFTDVTFFQNGSSQGLITWNNDIIIISFRGTEMNSTKIVTDVITDVNTLPAKFELGGKVHKGFLNAFESIWFGNLGMEMFLNTLLEENNERSIWLTGHSLGAALATICFTYLDNAKALYTIGSPRVGDQDFVNLSIGRSIFRIVNNKDPFTLTPPSLPVYDFYFRDSGELIFLDNFGYIKTKRRKESINTDDNYLGQKFVGTDFFNKDFIDNVITYSSYFKERYSIADLNIFDHMPIYYSLKLWNNMVEN